MTDPGPDPVTEQWIFGGSVIHSGRRAHLWLDPTGRELIYAAQSSYAVGYVYDVHVTRQGDRLQATRPTTPRGTAWPRAIVPPRRPWTSNGGTVRPAVTIQWNGLSPIYATWPRGFPNHNGQRSRPMSLSV
jgi:hypothetical protein